MVIYIQMIFFSSVDSDKSKKVEKKRDYGGLNLETFLYPD